MPLRAALYDVAALRAAETRLAVALGDPFEPMHRAGEAALRSVLRHWPQAQRLVVVCGPGNNGGDGFALALQALQSGRNVIVVQLPETPSASALARRASQAYVTAGGPVIYFDAQLPPADLVVDALFGIGLSRAPEGAATALIDAVNAQPSPVLALDVPSGVDADSGATPGHAVTATRTLEFIAPKRGLRTGAALDRIGLLELADLGVAAELFEGIEGCTECLEADDLVHGLPPRRRDSHKGQHGRVLCIGGDHGHGGAIVLTAEAALRSGAGLVDVATRAPSVAALLARSPEAMGHVLADDATRLADAAITAADVIAIGPGLGQSRLARTLLQQALESGKALVLDADALNLLAAGWEERHRKGQTSRELPQATVLTPHPGEAARLLGMSTEAVQHDRFAAARRLTDRYRCVVVLKGAGTVITGPERVPCVLAAGNPGMAVGGMGDVLAGVIAALLAQGLPPFDAARYGALLHAAAGDAAAAQGGERGMLPSDLLPWLRSLANPGAGAGSSGQ